MDIHLQESILLQLADPERAETSKRFHKNKAADEGEKIEFLGIRMPVLRAIAKEHSTLPFGEIPALLSSAYHESRLLALLILVEKYSSENEAGKEKIYSFYLNHTRFLNSWDLVDCSAYFIVGPYLENKSRSLLYELANSPNLWERRIAMLSTLHFIRKSDFTDSLKLAEILLHDEEDLIHKVVGWMLKEVGRRQKALEDTFLQKHYREMPRTMLRTAIELYPKEERTSYLKGQI